MREGKGIGGQVKRYRREDINIHIQNKMEINYDKTTCMIVETQHRTKYI